MGVYKINGTFQYVDDGLNIDESKPNNGLPTTTNTTNASTTNYRLISQNYSPGRNMFYESNKSVIVDRPYGYVLNGKNKYFTDIEKGEDIHNDNVRNALLVEFASFRGRPHLLEGKMDIFKYFLKTLYQNTTETDSVSKAEFFKRAYEDALKMGDIEGAVPYKEMFILYDEHTWHVRDVYGNTSSGGKYDTTAADVVKYWLDPLYETIGNATSDSSNANAQQSINIATPSAPTTAQNLTYRVGREDDNKDAIKSELLASLANLPEKPAQNSTPTIQEPTQSFNDYPTTGTRIITLPINASYTLRLLDRFGNEIMAVPYNASQKRIELPINTLGSFYEILPSKTRFYVHNGKGELLFEDALKYLDFSRLERFCMPLRDRKGTFVIMEHFLKDLSSYLLGTKKHFDSEIIKAIELFLYLFDRNKQRGKNYLECEMIDAIDRALAEYGNKSEVRL